MNDSEMIGQDTGKPKDGWSQSGPLSGTGGLSPSSNVTLQANFPESNDYTVQFGIVGPDESSSAGARKTQAIITWTVEGNHITRQIDVVNGTSITGTAQAVHVDLVDLSTLSGGPAGSHEYTGSISVAKGSRPSVQQPPYLTGALASLNPGGDVSGILVPQGAGVISVKVEVVAQLIGTHLNPDDVVVQFMASAVVLKQYSPLIDDGWVPLPSGCTLIRFVSTIAVGTIGYILYPTFGIDG